MLTDADRNLIAETGMLPPGRVAALVFALNAQADTARTAAAERKAAGDTHAAAALNGKAVAYRDAARMLEHVGEGHALHPRSYSEARRRALAYRARRTSQEAS